MAFLLAVSSYNAKAQRFSLSTNLLDYACLGTFNAECSYSVSRRWTLTLGAQYNPFTYRKGRTDQFQLRQQSYSFGARLWPWHTWSGWWMAGKIQYQEYNYGGILSRQTDEDQRRFHQVHAEKLRQYPDKGASPHFNVEFGLGGWTGLDKFCRYSCQQCGLLEMSGKKWFVLPDDIMIAFVYVF